MRVALKHCINTACIACRMNISTVIDLIHVCSVCSNLSFVRSCTHGMSLAVLFDHMHNCSYRMEATAAEEKQLKDLAYQLAAEGQSAEQSLKDMRKQTANKLDLAGKLCQDPEMKAGLNMIDHVTNPGYGEFQNLLTTTVTGLSTAQAAAARATEDWSEVLRKLVHQVSDTDILAQCGIDVLVTDFNSVTWEPGSGAAVEVRY